MQERTSNEGLIVSTLRHLNALPAHGSVYSWANAAEQYMWRRLVVTIRGGSTRRTCCALSRGRQGEERDAGQHLAPAAGAHRDHPPLPQGRDLPRRRGSLRDHALLAPRGCGCL